MKAAVNFLLVFFIMDRFTFLFNLVTCPNFSDHLTGLGDLSRSYYHYTIVKMPNAFIRNL